MKKSLLAAALLVATGAAQAATYDFAGTFAMRDPGGALMHNDATVTASMEFDMATGSGSATGLSGAPFFGQNWTAHNVTIQMTGPTTAVADMLFDWSVNMDIPVHLDMSVTMNADGSISMQTIDADGDGIIGSPMVSGPFPGFNAAFDGVATPVSAVPVPAAVWLFGSGLVGLAGVARRKAA